VYYNTVATQAGRDYLLPSYNVMRAALNLTVAKRWSDITSNIVAAAALKALYKDINTVDAVVGGLAEDVEVDNVVGPLYKSVLLTVYLHIHITCTLTSTAGAFQVLVRTCCGDTAACMCSACVVGATYGDTAARRCVAALCTVHRTLLR
jgi:Animal haem peroxidase